MSDNTHDPPPFAPRRQLIEVQLPPEVLQRLPPEVAEAISVPDNRRTPEQRALLQRFREEGLERDEAAKEDNDG